jgi:NAD(P)-dependent dehydrogenase (short-subunit alcohol dehydrogenase family)
MTKRVALVTGAGSKLGGAVARKLAAAGWRVALNDLLPTRIEALAAEISAAGGHASAYAADLTRKLALQTALQGILEDWERIDALVFIGSVQPPTPLLDLDEWDWHRTVDATLTAGFLAMQSVGRVMRELGAGVIVNIAAAAPNTAAYAAAAAGLQALSAAAKDELATHQIQVHWLQQPSAEQVVALVG